MSCSCKSVNVLDPDISVMTEAGGRGDEGGGGLRLCVHPVRGISGGATYREMQPRGCQMKSLRPRRCGVKGKSLAGSFQQQTPKARFTSPQPKNDEENISKITRRSAEYAYLGYEPDDVNEVGGPHSTPRKEHQNIVSPGDAYGADKS